ncbi:MAG: NAD(P)-binding domain-containing protein [Candidatus Omnitrophica bacterium]|nr:NAD(P)-binding domain-containing protein [Candidatus Omnitrophota bacterium]
MIHGNAFTRSVVSLALCACLMLNQAGSALAADNLRTKDARDGGTAREITSELVRRNADGGAEEFLFTLALEGAAIRSKLSLATGPLIDHWMSRHSPMRTAVEEVILVHPQQLREFIQEMAQHGVSRDRAIEIYLGRARERLEKIYTTAAKQGLKKKVILVAGSGRPQGEKDPLISLDDQIYDVLTILPGVLKDKKTAKIKTSQMLAGGTISLAVAFELAKNTEEISSEPKMSKIEATRRAHEKIYEWFQENNKSFPDLDKIWGESLQLYAVTSEPREPLTLKSPDGKWLCHGILFASAGLTFDGLLKVLTEVTGAIAAMEVKRPVHVFMDFKSYPFEDRVPFSIAEYVRRLYEAARKGLFDSKLIRLTFADTEGNLRDRDGWIAARDENEQARAKTRMAKDGGWVAVFIGGTGDMGKALADRLIKMGKKVYIGSRSPDPAAGVLTNRDAAQIGDYVFFTLPGKERVVEITNEDGTKEKVVTSPLREQVLEQARYLKKDAKVISVATVFERIDKKLTYVPPAKTWDKEGKVLERYNSYAEATQDWLRQKGAFNVVESWGIPNLPAEQMSDPSIRLKIQVAIAGDEKTCDLAFIKSFFDDLNIEAEPVYVGGLEQCCRIEELTAKIIVGNKEYIVALQAGLITVKEAMEYLESHGKNCDNKEFTAFIRQRLDPYLVDLYRDSQVLARDIDFVRDVRKSAEERELTYVALRRYFELEAGKQSPENDRIRETLPRYSLDMSGAKLNKALPGDFEAFVDALSAVEIVDGALVISAKAVLRNAGTVAILRALKNRELKLRVVVWSEKGTETVALELMGVTDLAAVIQNNLENVIAELVSTGFARERIAVIGQEGEIDMAKYSGVNMLVLRSPKAKESNTVNAMELVFARALASIYGGKITALYQSLAKAYFKGKQVTDAELKRLNDLKTEFFDMPLVSVKEEVARYQIAFEETVTDI